MINFYKKHELIFSIVMIVVYSFLQSLAIEGNAAMGVEYSISAIVTVALALVLYLFVRKNKLNEYYGFNRLQVPGKSFLYFIPMLVLISINLWNGVRINLPLGESACYLIYMMSVAFVEEVLFRGFLFKAISKDSLRMAIAITSITFGLGHLLNLINGSGMSMVPNLCQVVGAFAVGLLFAVVLLKGGSIWPCIMTHAAIDMVSLWANEEGLTDEKRMLFGLARMVIVALYILFIIVKKEDKQSKEDCHENM